MDFKSEPGEVSQTITRKRIRLKSSHVSEDTDVNLRRNIEGEGDQEGSRKKQVYQGLVRKFDIFKYNVLIIAEFWPSIVIGLEENKSSKVWIYSNKIPTAL